VASRDFETGEDGGMILVTGATGLIGNAIARRVAEGGEPVRALVRDPARARAVLPASVRLFQGDVTKPASLASALSGARLVFHAAGLPEQWAPQEAIFDRVNHLGTANLLQAALAAGVARVVYTSTMDVFAKDPDGWLRETQLDPAPKPTAYERSKQAAERAADRIRDQGLEVVFLNPAAVYGPTPTVTGMTEFFLKLLSGRAPLLPPGGMSLAYVDAVAEAHLRAAETGAAGERYLLADGYLTLRDLAVLTARVAGLRRVPPTAPAWLVRAVAGLSAPLARALGFTPLVAPGQLSFLLWDAKVDTAKARSELGYRPFPLEEGVRRTVEHLRRTGHVPG
jgi:dihydroflavonol-4-reductase